MWQIQFVRPENQNGPFKSHFSPLAKAFLHLLYYLMPSVLVDF